MTILMNATILSKPRRQPAVSCSKLTKNIRIGDADILVYGKKNYEIDYELYGVIRNFSGKGYAELYWNPVGDQWETTIDSVKITLNLPKSLHLTRDDVLVLA